MSSGRDSRCYLFRIQPIDRLRKEARRAFSRTSVKGAKEGRKSKCHCSYHLLAKQYNANCHFVEERKMLNIALISTTITPSLEYSPDALEGMELRSDDQRDMLARSSSSERTNGEEKNEK